MSSKDAATSIAGQCDRTPIWMRVLSLAPSLSYRALPAAALAAALMCGPAMAGDLAGMAIGRDVISDKVVSLSSAASVALMLNSFCDLITDGGADPTGTMDSAPALAACAGTGRPTLARYGSFIFKHHFLPPSYYTLVGIKGLVTFRVDPADRSDQILYFTGVSNGFVSGIKFDGNAENIPTPLSNIIRVDAANNIVFDNIVATNSSVVPVYFGIPVTNSGVQNSTFVATGQKWASEAPVKLTTTADAPSGSRSLNVASTAGAVAGRAVAGSGAAAGIGPSTLVGSGIKATSIPLSVATTADIPSGSIVTLIAPLADAGQAISFGVLGGTPAANHGNFSKNNSFSNIGADAIDVLYQSSFLEQGDVFNLGLAGWHPAASSVGLTVGVGCVYAPGSSDLRIVGNKCHGASGTGYDLPITGGLTFMGNEASDNGSGGIALVGTVNGFIISNNSFLRNNQGLNWAFTPLRRAGISLGIGATSVISNGVIGPNVSGDDRATPTQAFGLEVSGSATLINVKIDPTLTTFGNTVGPYSTPATTAPTALALPPISGQNAKRAN